MDQWTEYPCRWGELLVQSSDQYRFWCRVLLSRRVNYVKVEFTWLLLFRSIVCTLLSATYCPVQVMSLTPRKWANKDEAQEEYWWFGGSSAGNIVIFISASSAHNTWLPFLLHILNLWVDTLRPLQNHRVPRHGIPGTWVVTTPCARHVSNALDPLRLSCGV
jgi:hypothetical protein